MAAWTREEVEAIVDDYLAMLASELSGVRFDKTAHRRSLKTRLRDRSDGSVEFKHQNISAVLLDAGFPYVAGYKPRSNYQQLLKEVVADRLRDSKELLELARHDAERPMAVPEVKDVLAVLTEPPRLEPAKARKSDAARRIRISLATNYLEAEARNRSLGDAGESFVIRYEKARLVRAGKEDLAARIEHAAKVRGDGLGYDVLSFETTGAERFIEVKTTKYGDHTPFFVTRNEVAASRGLADRFHLYRLFDFKHTPRLYTLPGALEVSCRLDPATYLALPSGRGTARTA
ncbi:MAG TPA: DUF3883 domain-containing protein [Planctomycetota bacterium]|nr:DUF3883 domain-containing protein [Planctomycetota bacterium]